MSQRVRITLQPQGQVLEVPSGAALRDVLFNHGVEFPCGGRGECGACRVRVTSGRLGSQGDPTRGLSPALIDDGWRLACRSHVVADATLDLGQWETPILSDDSTLVLPSRAGLGIAVDLGTTTIVAQLVDRATGHVIGVRTALNPQTRFGADVMTRIEHAMREAHALTSIVREQVGGMVRDLLQDAHHARLARVVLVGNTAMHHLFCGIDVSPLAAMPFEPQSGGLVRLRPSDLGWVVPDETEVVFLPCVGGFVGSDLLAGIIATGLAEASTPAALVDLGTNGEVVVASGRRLLCASTAAGPAFEGARIGAGMRASIGAVSSVTQVGDGLACEVIGGGAPRGICGSGLVDALAVALDLGRLDPSGAIGHGLPTLSLCPPVELTQRDVREVQLAKGAIAAGLRVLMARCGLAPSSLGHLYLAGAFGNYINRDSARRLGLLPFPIQRVTPAGNTALLGAKLALFEDDCELADLRSTIEHVALHMDSRFQDWFAEEMAFPDPMPVT